MSYVRILIWDVRILIWDVRILIWDVRILIWDARILSGLRYLSTLDGSTSTISQRDYDVGVGISPDIEGTSPDVT